MNINIDVPPKFEREKERHMGQRGHVDSGGPGGDPDFPDHL